MESIVTCCLKKCPWSVLHVWFFIIMESAVQVCLMFREKPSLGINASSDPTLQELGVHLHLEINFFCCFKSVINYSILSAARKQLSALPTAKSLYIKVKSHLLNEVKSTCKNHLQTLSVQFKFGDSAELEASCRNWNRLLSGGQLSFFYEQLQIHYQLQWICNDGIYSAVRNVSYVILHVPPQPMCWVLAQ